MRELNGKAYEVLFNPNLNSMERYERIKDLLQEAYDKGARDERRAYVTLFEGDSNLEGLLDDFD